MTTQINAEKVIKINPQRPQRNILKAVAEVIKSGGLVVFPTETFYGLGANALNPKAVKKIFQVKGRPEKKPLIILIAKKSDLKKYVRKIPAIAYKLINKFWPGPLTLIFKKKKIVPKEVTAGGETVAVRLSSHPVARALVATAGVPITAPSANLSGGKPHRTIAGVLKELGKKKEIKLFLDAGEPGSDPALAGLLPGKPSTILDLTKKPPVIIRPGVITLNKILKKFAN